MEQPKCFQLPRNWVARWERRYGCFTVVTQDDHSAGIVGEVPVMLPTPSLPDVPLEEKFPEVQGKLANLTRTLQVHGIAAEPILMSGSATDSIIAVVNEKRIDLIILGSHGHGPIYELMVGTVTKSVLQRSGRPTLIIRGKKAEKRSSQAGQGRKRKETGSFAFTIPKFFGLSS